MTMFLCGCMTTLTDKSYKIAEARKLPRYEKMNFKDLLIELYPHYDPKKKDTQTWLKPCCIGHLMTSLDNSTKQSYYNSIVRIKPAIRTKDEIIPVVDTTTIFS